MSNNCDVFILIKINTTTTTCVPLVWKRGKRSPPPLFHCLRKHTNLYTTFNINEAFYDGAGVKYVVAGFSQGSFPGAKTSACPLKKTLPCIPDFLSYIISTTCLSFKPLSLMQAPGPSAVATLRLFQYIFFIQLYVLNVLKEGK